MAEHGIARAVAAHLRQADDQGQPPARFLVAQSKRPKLVELDKHSGLTPIKPAQEERNPMKVLSQVSKSLRGNDAVYSGRAS